MKHAGRITAEAETEVRYRQFEASGAMRFALALAGVLTWPLTVPLAILSRLSDLVFVTCAQFFAAFPYAFGIVFRYEFYRFALRRCGRNVHVGFGSYFLYRDVALGDHVLIGAYNIVHHCDFGSWVMTAERCTFLSGPHYHQYARTDLPMALQGGRLRRIRIGDDCWIGAHAIVMADVAGGSIVGAGAVVTRAVDPGTIVAGVPAEPIGRRG